MTSQVDPSPATAGTCPVNLWAPEFNSAFWSTINHLQESGVLGEHVQGTTPCYFATKFDDVFAVLRDAETYSSEHGVAILGGDDRAEPPKNEGRFLPEDLDPPVQKEWRALIDPFLTVRKVSAYRDAVVEAVDDLLDAALPKGRFPVMEDVLRPLQLRIVFSELLHLSGDEVEDWSHWSHDLFVGETPEIAGAAFVSIYQAAAGLVRERSARPLPDDLVSAVCTVPEIGGREPTLEERIAVVVPLAIAGTESVGTVLGGIVHHLASHPDDLSELVADLDLVPNAVEEGLRMFANVTALQRTTTRPVELRGVQLDAGAKVWTSYNGANRDPAQFPDPHRWDLHREDKRHLAFSVGPHRCLGANHARLMMTTALRRLLERAPRFTLPSDQHVTYFSMPTRGIHEFSIDVPTNPRQESS